MFIFVNISKQCMSTDKYDMYVRETIFAQNYVLILSINCATNMYIVKVIKIKQTTQAIC